MVNAVYQASSSAAFSKDYVLRDQIRRAVISTPSNIAEGFSRRSTKEFIQFLFISKGSTAEVQSQLYLAMDLDYINKEEFERLYDEADQVARLISGFMKYLKGIGS